MPRYIEIKCSEEMSVIICTALRNFAAIAYPKTPNSECNLVACDALLNAADVFEKNFSEKGVGLINRRLRMMLKTAIEAHYNIISELENYETKNQSALMLKVCSGEVVSQEKLHEAEYLDKQ
ncbi:MAG: hypothetical protein OQK98_02575 [Gammaproteobacteria bacterium]|nr:hypothetical protein [Gammaproteobacteria bacterium]